MRYPILLLLALFVPLHALAGSESSEIAALRARLDALEARLTQPAPAPRPSRASVSAARMLLGYRFSAFGVPGMLPVTISGGGGPSLGSSPTWTGAHTFSGDVTLNGGTGALGFGAGETIVPADGVMNVTGAVTASGQGFFGGANGAVAGSAGSSNLLGWATNDNWGLRVAGSTSPLEVKGGQADGAGAVGVRVVAWSDLTTAATKIASFGDNGTSAYAEKLAVLHDGALLQTPTALTIADSGGVGAATHTALPVGGRVLVTCNDADTCEWTITETSASAGECHTIVNAGTNSLVMKNAAGQALFPAAGDQTLGQNDELTVCYDSTLSAWLGTAAVNR